VVLLDPVKDRLSREWYLRAALERSQTGADVAKELESVKHLLWHGNTQQALERMASLSMELSLIQAHSVSREEGC
jgi:hypothetical protein